MALISMRQMLDHAAEFGYGVPAFNVNNLEQMCPFPVAGSLTGQSVLTAASMVTRICSRLLSL
ncbi:hypothetical protein EDB98_104403, partial [Pseudomonas fluorescens]